MNCIFCNNPIIPLPNSTFCFICPELVQYHDQNNWSIYVDVNYKLIQVNLFDYPKCILKQIFKHKNFISYKPLSPVIQDLLISPQNAKYKVTTYLNM